MTGESAEAWSSPWSARRAATRSDLCALVDVKDEVRESIRRLFVAAFEGSRPPSLALEIGASRRQSAELLIRTGEAAIFFDLAQSMVLKQVLRLIRDWRPYHELARLFGACSGLAVADRDTALASALLSRAIHPSDEHFVHREASLQRYLADYTELHEQLLFDWVPLMVDAYLVAHEAGHFAVTEPEDVFTTRLKAQARESFAFAVDQVCYENRSDFEAIATYWGEVPMDADALAEERRTLARRRAYYEQNADELIEEIAADYYALTAVSTLMRQIWSDGAVDPEELLEKYGRFVQNYYLLFTLSDLHQAMIGRAKAASAAAGMETEKPADIADMHLRKVAILHTMADLAQMFLPGEMQGKDMFGPTLERFSRLIQRQKHCVDALLLMPVTRAVREQRMAAQEESPKIEQAAEVFDLGEIFGHGRMSETFRNEAFHKLTRWTFADAAAAG